MNENKKARKEKTRPFIIVDFEVQGLIIYFKIKNLGNSPAENIIINHNREFKNVPEKLDYLPPNREILYRLNLMVDKSNKDSDVCKINVNYTDLENTKFSNEYKVDLNTYIDMASHSKGELSNISKQLNNIYKSLGGSSSRNVASYLKDIKNNI